MPFMGFTKVLIPNVSASARAVAKWLPTIVVACATTWAVDAWTSPGVANPIDSAAARVRAIGRDYPRGLAKAYATSWIEGAKALESGRGVPDALGVVEKSWKAGRTSLFQETLSPCFSAVVPEGRPEAETSAFDRAALAVLWREFAAGLASGD
jgi:hypothetical protein